MIALKRPTFKKNYQGKRTLKEKPGGKKNPSPFRWQRPDLRGVLMVIVPALGVVAVLAAVLVFTSRTNRYTIEGQAVQYYAGSMYRITDGAKMTRTRNGETVLKQGDAERTMTALPVYYQNQQMIVRPQDMVYVASPQEPFSQLEHFTELVYQSNGAVTAQRGKDSAPLYQGFLYDGGDFYLFLEPVVITVNGYERELAAMSYVEAVYTGSIMIYDHGTGDFLIEVPSGSVQARAASGDYTVSLLSDSIEFYDGTKILLFVRPDLLDRIV